jgi:hypothetical protein
MMLSGVVGSAIFGLIVDKYRNYKTMLIVGYLGTSFTVSVFYIVLYVPQVPKNAVKFFFFFFFFLLWFFFFFKNRF